MRANSAPHDYVKVIMRWFVMRCSGHPVDSSMCYRFAIFSAWSGQTIFERWTIGLFNVIFTAWPPVVLGLFDRPVEAEQMMRQPTLYHSFQKRSFSLAVHCYASTLVGIWFVLQSWQVPFISSLSAILPVDRYGPCSFPVVVLPLVRIPRVTDCLERWENRWLAYAWQQRIYGKFNLAAGCSALFNGSFSVCCCNSMSESLAGVRLMDVAGRGGKYWLHSIVAALCYCLCSGGLLMPACCHA